MSEVDLDQFLAAVPPSLLKQLKQAIQQDHEADTRPGLSIRGQVV